jgi:hypothetical protein
MQIAMPADRNNNRDEAEKGSDQERFLQAYVITCSVQRASRLAKVRLHAHSNWMQEDPTYPGRFRQARELAAQTLEDAAVRRAIEGVRRPILYKGKPVYIRGEPQYQIEYSDQLLILLLKANNPEKFKDRSDVTHKWDGDIDKLSIEELRTFERTTLAKYPELAEDLKKLEAIEVKAEEVKEQPKE